MKFIELFFFLLSCLSALTGVLILSMGMFESLTLYLAAASLIDCINAINLKLIISVLFMWLSFALMIISRLVSDIMGESYNDY